MFWGRIFIALVDKLAYHHGIILNTIHNTIHNKLLMDNMLTYMAEVEPRIHGYISDSH